ncbi:RING finger protein 121-like isoform X1 [Vespa mandarinia]|uniref:RING finger protein 121-like isoform X1 n=2 Tax=Vespa mandarinia TaxID=7446 RepID=UPI001608350D|nr:RING finger protein 121-like isoform X1 [Vespa mandarinia]XP_035734030.1 RING finger protein 121-like isoform X1 [Vespa mandarinia]XP_035734032.1 RING finger protein 121-like isoform X1 [Vespa mandarinia]XP_035734033.1 RING finger protein 121-like isoform X1 [Vespa mandarinia]XP_035734034.1 RING finger protein 121-like isoform X1 [Vespa mandarinia]XP_035734035.1 RING finger protein 121-like isoform X1 [Vespa mandarinia]
MDLHTMPNKSEAEMTAAEKWRVEHIKMHKQHQGHESMHAEMLLILLVTLTVAQVILIEWKKRHFKSYQLITLIVMWIIPFGMSLNNHWWRFIFLWLVSSCITGLVVRKAIQKPIQGTTPRLVYKWFYFIYKLSYVLGIIGYIIVLATFFGLNLAFNVKPQIWMDCGILFLFYGLYFGVLGRDVAEICADKMASHIGYYAPGSMPTRTLEPGVCAVCGNKLLVSEEEEGVIENTFKLSCEHVFHEFCIRGWCIVGKKQTCPYCKEKVDLKKMFRNPWERPHVLYGQLLDWIRWLVAWQPLILFLVQGINWALGLEESEIVKTENGSTDATVIADFH